MGICDWSSDVFSSDLAGGLAVAEDEGLRRGDDADLRVELVLRLGSARSAQHHDVAVAGARDHPTERVVWPFAARSEARSEGIECVSTCRSRWSTYQSKTNNQIPTTHVP